MLGVDRIFTDGRRGGWGFCWEKGLGGWCGAKFVGILRFAQDDSKDRQRQGSGGLEDDGEGAALEGAFAG
jgi:hypothetical protein